MNSKHSSFPSFDFLQPGTLKFIRLSKLISSGANSFCLIVYIDEDNKQLKFIWQTNEKALYAEKLIFYAVRSGLLRCFPLFPLELMLSLPSTSAAQVAVRSCACPWDKREEFLLMRNISEDGSLLKLIVVIKGF